MPLVEPRILARTSDIKSYGEKMGKKNGTKTGKPLTIDYPYINHRLSGEPL